MRRLALSLFTIGFAMFGFAGIAYAVQPDDVGPPEHVVICHAAGLEGTTHYVTLDLPWVAVYGQAGHFNENGTPRAGHEQDYLGACEEETPDTTVPVTEPPTTLPTAPETTVPEVTVPETPTTQPHYGGGDITPPPPPAPPAPPAKVVPAAPAQTNELPFTGSDVIPLTLLGLALCGSGAWAVKSSRTARPTV